MMFFIPARKGSRRIPNKNTAHVSGKSLIHWTLSSLGLVLKKIKRAEVLVSSDDLEVLFESSSLGFPSDKRPDSLCSDKTKMSDVLNHYLPIFKKAKTVCVLYPTSPLRTAKHIIDAVHIWQSKGTNDSTLMSVTPVDHRPYGLMSVQDDGFLKCNHPYGELFYQSQNLPPSYRANGAIFIIPYEVIEKKLINSQLFCKKTIPFIMDYASGHEIDEPHDIPVAEALLNLTMKKPFHKIITPFHETNTTMDGLNAVEMREKTNVN